MLPDPTQTGVEVARRLMAQSKYTAGVSQPPINQDWTYLGVLTTPFQPIYRVMGAITICLIAIYVQTVTNIQVMLDGKYEEHAKVVMATTPILVTIETGEYENAALDQKPVLRVLKELTPNLESQPEKEEIIDSHVPFNGIVPLYTIRQTFHREPLGKLEYGYRHVLAAFKGANPLKDANDWLKAHGYRSNWSDDGSFNPLEMCGKIHVTEDMDSHRKDGLVGPDFDIANKDGKAVGVTSWYQYKNWYQFSPSLYCNLTGKFFLKVESDTNYYRTYFPEF